MAYNDVISRDDASSLIPEETSTEIISGMRINSVALTLMRQATMSRKQQRTPVLASLPQAYFVNGDTGLKQTSKIAWENKFLVAEELAVIVPIPEAVLDDAEFDIWGEARPLIEEAFAIALDQAILFGTNKPTTWGESVIEHADGAGNELVRGSVSGQDLAGDVSAIMGLVENDGFDVNGFIARKAIKGSLRNLRNTQGDLIFAPSLAQGTNADTLWGEPIRYVVRDGWVNSEADMFAGDWSQAVVATRQDFTYKLLDQAVITDNSGAIIYNLAQQDMVAMRVVGRFAYQVANVINRDNDVEANRSPFAVLRPVGYA